MAETPGKMYALAAILTFVAVVAILLRFYARHIKQAKLSWDDYMILPAMFFTIGTAICMVVGAAIGDLGRHTAIDESGGPRTGYPIFTHRTEVFEQVQYASQLTTTLTFAFTKVTVLLFYKRVFPGEKFQKAIYVALGMIFVWTVGFFFSNLFQCYPISMNWTKSGANEGYCVNNNMMYLAQNWSDVLTDVMILSLPLPKIWAMQMPIRHRLGVCGIFLLGTLTVGAGVAKLVVFHVAIESAEHGAADITYLLTPTMYWPMVESSLGIVGACLPLLRPLFAGGSSSHFVRRLNSVVLPPCFNYQDSVSGTSDGSFERLASRTIFHDNFSGGLNTHGLLDSDSSSGNIDKGISVLEERKADDYV